MAVIEKAIITIYIPEGRAKALKTYNPKMGVIGGISVLRYNWNS